MPLDPACAAEVHAWLTKVSADLRAAEHDLAADPPLLEDSLFHCQQAAEKTLKAFLTSRNTKFSQDTRPERAGTSVRASRAFSRAAVSTCGTIDRLCLDFSVPPVNPENRRWMRPVVRSVWSASCSTTSRIDWSERTFGP